MRRIDFDTWEEIFLTITRNKTRSVLTAFGIFWGIFMLVALMGGARGMQDMLSRQFQGFATNSGFMATNNTSKAYKGFQQGRWWSMENQDVERLRNSVPGLDIVTATIAQWGVNIVYEQYSISGTLKGLYPEYDRIEEPLIRIGRSLNETDIRDRRKVCVIGKRIYETLFPKKDDPCGKFIEINGIYYRVVGVNEATGNMSVNGQSETSVVIPFSTMQQNYNRGNRIDMLGYTAKKGYSISQVEKDVERIVKQAHAIHPDDEQAVIRVNAEAMFSMMDNLFTGIRVLGWLVGLGTLLAGAIGVSNIMMITVKERTTEIGIRRAIGAERSSIVTQFLIEAAMLCGIGGIIGLSIGTVATRITGKLLVHMDIWPSIPITLGAFLLSVVLGILFGIYPAAKASKLQPVEALRAE